MADPKCGTAPSERKAQLPRGYAAYKYFKVLSNLSSTEVLSIRRKASFEDEIWICLLKLLAVAENHTNTSRIKFTWTHPLSRRDVILNLYGARFPTPQKYFM
jgi:hypothetical protein